MDDKLVRMSDVEQWILTEPASIDTPADRDAVVERMRYSIPAVDAVEVVRCRKCKHWEIDWPPSGFGHDNPRYFCSVNDIFPTGDWFCKDGDKEEVSHDV